MAIDPKNPLSGSGLCVRGQRGAFHSRARVRSAFVARNIVASKGDFPADYWGCGMRGPWLLEGGESSRWPVSANALVAAKWTDNSPKKNLFECCVLSQATA